MQLIDWFVRNPVKVSVGVLLCVLFGILSILRMPMQLTPEVELPTITVETRWIGASPQEVERDIIEKQEEQLKATEGMTKMSSESMDSMGRVTLEFPVGTDLDSALVRVSTRLQQVRDYPVDVEEPVISTSDANSNAIAWFILHPRVPDTEEIEAFIAQQPQTRELLAPVLRAHNPGLALYRLRDAARKDPRIQPLLPKTPPLDTLRDFAEDVIEAQFERVDGVANSNVLGGTEREMQVIVDPQLLAARQLTIVQLRNALQMENRDTSAGDFWEGKRRWAIRTQGRFESPEEIANTVVVTRDDGRVYVRDVAEVKLGYKKPDGFVRRYGEDTLAINCLRATGANVLDVMNQLRQVNAALNENVLSRQNLQLTQVYDETEYIYSAIGLVNSNIVVGSILTICTLLLFLRDGRSTLIVSLAIPISLVSAFLVLDALGRSLNVVSLAGLAFAVGMLVDNAIVTLENIYRRYQMGESPWVASVRGVQEVWGAIVASSLTTLAVFVPVVFMQDQAGQLFRDIALAISAAVALSLVVSVVVIPTFAARLLAHRRGHTDDSLPPELLEENWDSPRRPRAKSKRPPWWRFRWLTAPADRLGAATVRGVVGINALLQRQLVLRLATVAGFVGAAAVVTWALLPKVEYLPVGNRNLAIGLILPPPGYSVDTMAALGSSVEEVLRPYWDVDPGSPEEKQLDHPMIGDFFYVARGRQVFLGLRAYNPLVAGRLIPLIRKATENLPGAMVMPFQSSLFERGLAGGRSIDVEIVGPDLDKLIQLGGTVMGQVRQLIPDSNTIPRPSLDKASPEMHVRLKREVGRDSGFSSVDLGYTVDALVDGAYAGDYFIGGTTIDLVIRGRDEFAEKTQDLEQLPIATPYGEIVPLSAVANVDYASGPEQINHRERERAITIQVSPPIQVPLEDAMNLIQSQIVERLIAQGQLGSLYQINLAGTADKLRQTWQSLRGNFVLAIIITYLLMAALFESWLYPLVVIFSVPLGGAGGVAALFLLNLFVPQQLDVLTMLGFVILIGTVVNNAILIVHQSLNHMRDEEMPRQEAILESVRTRTRPIAMTTGTTILGLLPLVVFPGAGSELYRGLGAVVLGGLFVSSIFTLFFIPALFTLAMDTKQLLLRLLFGQPVQEYRFAKALLVAEKDDEDSHGDDHDGAPAGTRPIRRAGAP